MCRFPRLTHLLIISLTSLVPAAAAAQTQNGPITPFIVAAPQGSGALRALVMRPEVQNELRLSLQQKNALAEAFPSGPRMGVRVQAEGGGSEEEMRKKIQEQVAAQFAAMDDKLKEILKPEQTKRLRELDLQWRGPVALADGRIADEVRLSAEHRAEIGKIVSEYNRKRFEILRETAQVSTDGNRQAIVLRAPESESPLSPRRKQLDAARKDAEVQILAVLSGEERAPWKSAQGAPFVFRKDQPGGPKF